MSRLDHHSTPRLATIGAIGEPRRSLLTRLTTAVLAMLHLVATVATAHAVIRIAGNWGTDPDTRVGADIALGLTVVFLATAITKRAAFRGVVPYQRMCVWMVPAALLLVVLTALAIADSGPVLLAAGHTGVIL